MSVIAVAGGTGNLGRAVVDALNATGKITVLVLARQASEDKEKEIGAKIIAINYDDVPSITATLEKNKIDTVISTLTSAVPVSPDLALIAAADKSSTTKRFIPSIWGVPDHESMVAIFPPAKNKIDTLAALEASSLEYTSIYNGYFIDYFAVPKVPSYLSPLPVVADIANNFAAIPGSGDVPVVFTHTWDISKFVAAYVQKSTWEKKEAYIIGGKATWNEFIAIAEEAKGGGTKFTVETDSLEKLSKGEITELPSHPPIYPFFPKQMLQGIFAAFGIFFEKGLFDLKPTTQTLNEEFPDIKARTVKEIIDAAWKE
ncbi:hypothetical protein B0H66DRAFT_551497 [Apodospora peruviana]|uniref:NmrA-like domain-containing protein n=1 Tax=Apodospora peruviana TaxID=516989 RepID=A0AAE0IKG7_9PEZI|nr:hypothetical protein B0H66DRAFT_551497 [Apodospora peruviana]